MKKLILFLFALVWVVFNPASVKAYENDPVLQKQTLDKPAWEEEPKEPATLEDPTIDDPDLAELKTAVLEFCVEDAEACLTLLVEVMVQIKATAIDLTE